MSAIIRGTVSKSDWNTCVCSGRLLRWLWFQKPWNHNHRKLLKDTSQRPISLLQLTFKRLKAIIENRFIRLINLGSEINILPFIEYIASHRYFKRLSIDNLKQICVSVVYLKKKIFLGSDHLKGRNFGSFRKLFWNSSNFQNFQMFWR